MKILIFRLAAVLVLALLLGGCTTTVQLPEFGWVCGNGLFDDLAQRGGEPPCTGTKDLALAGEALPPDGD